MSRNLAFTRSATRQLASGLDFIREQNPAAAANLARKIRVTISRLRQYPGSGRVVPEIPNDEYRGVVIPPYRVFYRFDDRLVTVVTVGHEAQDIPGSNLI